MHPFKKEADSSRKSKAGSMGKTGNLDIGIMKHVGENNPKKLYSSSSASMQHKDQSRADGMKRGGHVGKPKHSKPKVTIQVPANPPSPDPSMVAAGAGSSPAPAPPMMPPPGQPPMKRGGHADAKEDAAMIKKMVKPEAMKHKMGGKVEIPDLSWQRAGGGSGMGRLQESREYDADNRKPMKKIK